MTFKFTAKEKFPLYQKLLFLLSKIENNVLLSSIKKGFILIIQIVMTGSFALLVKSFPLHGFQTYKYSVSK